MDQLQALAAAFSEKEADEQQVAVVVDVPIRRVTTTRGSDPSIKKKSAKDKLDSKQLAPLTKVRGPRHVPRHRSARRPPAEHLQATTHSRRQDLQESSTVQQRQRAVAPLVPRLSTAPQAPRWGTADSSLIGPLLPVVPLTQIGDSEPDASLRPVTQGTLTLARLNESELQGGRQIWRGSRLDPEIAQYRQDQLEFAMYRFECSRSAGMASRESARQWRARQEYKSACRDFPSGARKDSPDSVGGWSKRLRKSLGINLATGRTILTHMPEPSQTLTASEVHTCPEEVSENEQSSRVSDESSPTVQLPRVLPSVHAAPANLSGLPKNDTPRDSKEQVPGRRLGLGNHEHDHHQRRAKSPRDMYRRTETTFSHSHGHGVHRSASSETILAHPTTSLNTMEAKFSTASGKGDSRTSHVTKTHEKNHRANRALRKLKERFSSKANANTGEGGWDRITDDERAALQYSFSKNDLRNGEGCLDLQQTLQGFRDLGLKGRTNREREEIRRLAFEHIAIFGELDMFTFCFVVVPQVREKLRQMSFDDVKQKTEQTLGRDVQKSLTMSISECTGLVESILGNPLMGVEAITELRSCFQAVVAEQAALKEKNEVRRAQAEEASRGMGMKELKRQGTNSHVDTFVFGCWTACPKKQVNEGPTIVTFGELEHLVQQTQERYERLQLEHLARIKADIPMYLVADSGMEMDILPLHASFRRFDTDHTHTLDMSELRSMLQEFGLLSGKEDEDKVLMKVMREAACGHEDSLNFAQFLQVLYDVREKAKELRFKESKKMFESFDKDRNGQLDVQEVAVLFQLMGLAPTCQRGQDEIKRILQNCDTDNSGELDLEEFQHLVQLVSEKLRSITRFREMELGLSLSFTDVQIREYRDFFWHVDRDGNGHLDLQELRTLMQMMRQRIDGDDLRLLMQKIDKDNSGSIDFSEFLQLVHMIEMLVADDHGQPHLADDEHEKRLDQQVKSPKSTKPRATRRVSQLAASLAHVS